MNYRLEHKNKLKAYLESIVFDSSNLVVQISRNNTIAKYPHLLISSADLLPNSNQFSLLDNQTYNRVYSYSIFLVQKAPVTNQEADIIEANFDELEDLVLDLLQSKQVRNDSNNSTNKWQDLVVSDITSPYQDLTIDVQNALIVKRITINIEETVAF